MSGYDAYNKAVALREAALERNRENARKYPEFVRGVKNGLVEGALWKIYGGVLEGCKVSDFGVNVGKMSLSNYIKENGADRLINSFRGKTYLLSEIARCYDKAVKNILEDVDEDNDESFSVDPDKEQKFYDDLSNSGDIDDITNTIRMRVVGAEEKMETDNIKDKLDMDDITQSAADRINAIKASNDSGDLPDEAAEESKQEAAAVAKMKMNQIASDRPRGVLEQLTRSLSERVIADTDLAKVYTENGQVDYDKVVNASEAIYALMETLYSLGIEYFDEDDIKDLVC